MTWLWCCLAAITMLAVCFTLGRSRAYRVWSCRRYGLCPLCDSSPPRQSCPVCRGDYKYGSSLPAERRERWISRYRELTRR